MIADPGSERVVRCCPPPAARAKEEDEECVGELLGPSLPSGWGVALVLSVTTDAQPAPGSPCPMFGHDARHTGRTTVTPAAPELRGTFKWIYDPDDTHPNNPDEVDAIHGGVAIGPDDKLFFGTTRGRFISVHRVTG